MSSEEIKNLRRKLKKARENGKPQEISDCCCNLAAYLSDEEEHEEALQLYKESLTCCEQVGNKVGAGLANRMIGEECINLGYFEDALKHITVFLKYAEDECDKVEEQRGLVLKGHAYFTQAEYLMDTKQAGAKKVQQLLEQSMEAYKKSFAICNTELNDINERERLQMKARLLQNKSLVLSRQGKLDFAQAHLIKAIKICTKEKFNDTEHICYLSLGDLYVKKNEAEKALNIFDKALELSHSTQKKRDSLVAKAKTYIVMDNLKLAKSTLKKVYKLRVDDEIKILLKNVASVIQLENILCSTPEDDFKARHNVHKKLGHAYCSLRNYKKGVRSYLNMLGCAQKAELPKSDLIKCYDLICKAFTHNEEYTKALFYSHQEVQTITKWSPEKAFKTYYKMAKLHELNDSEFEDIFYAYSEAKNKAQQFKNGKLQVKCLKKLIHTSQTFNKPDKAAELEKELQDLKNGGYDSSSSCDSGNNSESDISTDSERDSDHSSGVDIVDLLSDSDAENEEYDRPKERCKRTKFTIKRNEKGETDLHVASIKGNYKRAKLLIDKGHPVDVRDAAGWTPLHEACNHGYVDIVNLLLDFGANIDDKGGSSCDGTTPLHDAAINGQFKVIHTLIKRGASTLVLNESGETPLQCLLAWKNNTALSADEEAVLAKTIEALKSPLDTQAIRKHIKPTKNLCDKQPNENKQKKTGSEKVSPNTINKSTRTRVPSAVSEYKETMERLRGKRQANHRNSHGSHSADSDDDDCGGNLRKKPKPASVEEYRDAIVGIRHGWKVTPSEAVKNTPKRALINENEYVENCIVDDDDEEEEPEDEPQEEKPEEEPLEEKPEDEPLEEKLEEEIHSRPRKTIRPSPSPERKPLLEKEMLSKPWLKSIPMDLLEDMYELPTKRKENENITDIGARVPEADVDEVPTQETAPDTTVKSADITVKIFNEQFTISISESEIDKLQVKWLIREASKRYPTLKNPDSYVCLKTKDGPLMESQSLSGLANTEIECVVTKWKSLPLSERYEKICTITSHPDISSEVRAFGFKHTVQPQVVETLKKSSKAESLTLSNLKLSSLTLIPICKAIKYETFVQRLHLNNNYFGDKGVELIVKIFEKCIIEELDLSGCNITSTGVYYFSDALSRMNEISKDGLEVLNFSNNPITDDAIAAVYNIIEQLPNLRTLDLDRCELETVVSVNNSSNLVIVQGNKFESPHRVND